MKKIQFQLLTLSLCSFVNFHCHLDQPLPIGITKADFKASFEDNCTTPPIKVIFDDSKSENVDKVKWYFNDGKSTDSSLQRSPTFTYTKAGDYTVKLIVTNKAGITATKTELLTVKAAITWDSAYKNPMNRFITGGTSVRQIDNGYIATGYDEEHNKRDILCIKTDEKGNVIWKNFYGTKEYSERSYAIEQTIDKGYIILGVTDSTINREFYVVKLNSNGVKLWSKTYGGDRDDFGFAIHPTKDSGYILVGQSLWATIIKIDAVGNIQWKHSIGEKAFAIKEDNDGNFIILSNTSTRPMFVKVRKDGVILVNKVLTEVAMSEGRSLEKTDNGNFIILGYTIGQIDLYLIKVDPNGIILPNFPKKFGNTTDAEIGYSVKQLPDKGYMLSGLITDPNINSTAIEASVLLIRTNEKGEQIGKDKIINGARQIPPFWLNMALTNDCGYIITTQHKEGHFRLIKLNKNGEF